MKDVLTKFEFHTDVCGKCNALQTLTCIFFYPWSIFLNAIQCNLYEFVSMVNLLFRYSFFSWFDFLFVFFSYLSQTPVSFSIPTNNLT